MQYHQNPGSLLVLQVGGLCVLHPWSKRRQKFISLLEESHSGWQTPEGTSVALLTSLQWTTLEQHMRFIQYLLACYAELPDCLSSCKKQDIGEVTKSRSERKNYKEVTSQSPLRYMWNRPLCFCTWPQHNRSSVNGTLHKHKVDRYHEYKGEVGLSLNRNKIRFFYEQTYL